MTATSDTTTKLRALDQLRPAGGANVDTTVPILPEWLRDRLAFSATARNWARRNTYRGGAWALRAPAILALLVLYSPRGLGRLVGTLGRYLYDYDSATVRHQHAVNTETADYVRAQGVRHANLKARWLVAGTVSLVVAAPALTWTAPYVLSALVGLALFWWIVKLIPGRGLVEVAAGLAAAGACWWFLPMALVLVPTPPVWPLAVLAVLAVLALGWHGRPRNKPLVKAQTLAPGIVEKLTAPFVIDALCRLNIAGMTDKTRDEVRLLMDVARVGPGYQVDLELPAGVEASAVMEKRGKLSAALRRELGCVWPAVGTRHEGHLALFVSDQPMNKATQKPWPLLKEGTVDLFRPVPAVTDQQGQWVDITLAYANAVIGATPRMGKTFFLRELLLIGGLDPRAKVYAIDNKGTGDLAPTALFAHFYSVGEEPEDVEAQLAAMREVRQEMRRRARIIRELPREECPESKVTSVLANRRDLCPIVIGIDETQVWFEDAEKAARDEFTAIVTDLVKRGPALGIIVLLATQNVTAKTIPTSISNNAVIRFCLKVFGWAAGDQVLGTGAYKSGLDAQMFAQEDKGIGYLRADGATPRIVRSVFGLDAVAAEKVALRARLAREAKGLLTGQAAGEEMEREEQQVNLLEDARAVMGESRAVMLGELRDGLARLRPATWAHLDNDALGGMLKEAGVRRATIYSTVSKREGYGVKAEWLDVAATQNVDAEGPESGS